MSAARRSGRWLRPPPPGRSSAHSLRGRAHQIFLGSSIAPPVALDGEGRGGLRITPLCRVFGSVSADPVSIRSELIDADNPLIRQSEDHDSGWGMAVYERADGAGPRVVRFPQAAHADAEFLGATEIQGRIFNVHVRRAT